jgi:dipeptidyl aminopeptidase/acylaminoacyl peptidase
VLGLVAVAAVTAVNCGMAQPPQAALPTWSPSVHHRQVAFTVPRLETGAIEVARPGTLRPTFAWLSYESPPTKLVWGPAEARAAFSKRTGAIAVVNAGRFGTAREIVPAAFPTPTELGEWAPDGRRLVFARADRIYTVDVVTLETREIAQGVHPTWSPDGAAIAYATPDGLNVVRPDGSREQTLVASAGIEAIAWAPDSSRLAFLGRVIGIVSRDGGVPGSRTSSTSTMSMPACG